ncbi:MAG TPA: FAD-linked oxidase C-terminal domain-containing protein [Burkholderiales bacterium]|nr:FAD-linked oxidase C-terminal domain-containing protein [Burkholderiales bacterium]
MREPSRNDSTATRARRLEVARALGALLPSDCLLSREEELRPYECDALAAHRQQPLLVALPRTEEQVCAVVRECRRLGVPLVARGGGTGLSGGAMPHAAGVLLSLARFDRILELDPRSRTARVQPGVRNLAVSEAAAPFGLYYAPDPSSQLACTIDGELIELGGAALDAPGLNLLALALGSEGLLLIVTEVLLKLVPKPEVAQVVMASFDDVGKAGEAVAAIIAAGIIPAGLEMMDRRVVAAVEPFVRAGYDMSAEAILLAESDGTAEEVAEEVAAIEAVVRAAGATALAVSRSEAERLRFWSGRKNAFPAAGRLSPDYYCMDGTIPRRKLAEVLRAIAQMEQKYGLQCLNVFHAGDGNLHPLILFDANQSGQWERAEHFGTEILELCVSLGGTVTGEHGVGVEKLNPMCVQFSAAERTAFFAIKEAFDPPGLLNPGKAIPTLTRCAEYGREHVRRGQTRHPDLPRF